MAYLKAIIFGTVAAHDVDADAAPADSGPHGPAILAEAARLGLQRAIADTTPRDRIDGALLSARPSMAGRFDLIVSRENSDRPKPAPDVYLAALSQLRLDASEAIAIEDSADGVAAALAAGIATYAVTGRSSPTSDFAGASGTFERLSDVRIAELAHRLGRDIVVADVDSQR
jgi:beta-phosphoglucomutase-like phosphatase (HAD superfamily)